MIKSEDQPKIQKEEIKATKIKNIIWTMKSSIIVEYWFGIFRYNSTNGQLLKPSRQMKILSFVIPIAYVALFIFCIHSSYQGAEYDKMNLLETLPKAIILLQYLISALTVTFCLQNKCKSIIENLADLDTMLMTSTNDSFYKKSRRETKKYMILVIGFHFINSLLDLVTDLDLVASTIVALPIYYLENLEVLVFCNLILMVQRRLETVNDYLKQFLKDKENGNVFVFTVKERNVDSEERFHYIGEPSHNNMKIRELAFMYDTIGNICALINETFNLQIFMTLISTFAYVLIAIWTTVYFFRTPGYSSAIFMTVILWCLTILFSVVMMSFACERLLLARNTTKILVNKIIMDYDLPNIMRVQAKAFMGLIEAWPLQIFVYDMFCVDINLMLKFISVATTYLIVIIQLSHFI